MARKILCSEFDLTARRLAIPTLNIPRRLAPEQRKWDFTQHRGIKDCVPVRDAVSEDHIFFGGEFEPTVKTALAKQDSTEGKRGRFAQHDIRSTRRTRNYRMQHTRTKDGRWSAINNGMTVEEADRTFGDGHSYDTHKDQIKTIKGRREEVVRESRRLSREFRKFVLASLDELDRKEF